MEIDELHATAVLTDGFMPAASGGATWTLSNFGPFAAVAMSQSGDIVAVAAQGTWTRDPSGEWINDQGNIRVRCVRL
jgi:hypothetical protein